VGDPHRSEPSGTARQGRDPDADLVSRSHLTFRITDLFQEHGIAIPFPQRDVHLFETKADKK
jgi:small-conductance mechanosensitive channel